LLLLSAIKPLFVGHRATSLGVSAVVGHRAASLGVYVVVGHRAAIFFAGFGNLTV
jgi:hypothetical protein